MNTRNKLGFYGFLSIALHWPMLLLIAAVHACIQLRDNFQEGSSIRDDLKPMFLLPVACGATYM